MRKWVKILIILFIAVLLGIGGYFGYKKYQDYLEEERIKNAIIKIDFIEPLEVEFNSDVKLSDLIVSINGELISDFVIDTKKVGEQEINFKYIN